MTPAEIWKKLTPSQRVTLLDEANVKYGAYDGKAEIRAGLRRRGTSRAEWPSGSARHALGRKGLLDMGQTVSMPGSGPGFHTPRELSPLGRDVVNHGLALLSGAVSHSTRKAAVMPKKKTALSAPTQPVIDEVRRLMRSTGFDEEEVYGGAENQLHFASREEGDVLEGRADPGTVRYARDKAKEIEAAVPGAKARAEVVDEWVSITVTLPGGDAPHAKAPAKAEPLPEWAQRLKEKAPKHLRPGDEIKYTNFTIGGSHEGTAVVTWDHGKSVEARTLPGEKIRLERAADGSLRRFS